MEHALLQSTHRNEAEYIELLELIDKIFEDLGQKLQKEVVSIEDKALMQYRSALYEAEKVYEDIQITKN